MRMRTSRVLAALSAAVVVAALAVVAGLARRQVETADRTSAAAASTTPSRYGGALGDGVRDARDGDTHHVRGRDGRAGRASQADPHARPARLLPWHGSPRARSGR